MSRLIMTPERSLSNYKYLFVKLLSPNVSMVRCVRNSQEGPEMDKSSKRAWLTKKGSLPMCSVPVRPDSNSQSLAILLLRFY